VLSQDYSNWEYIIVDNCSTDRSLDIARQYCARDPRIRVTTNEHFLSLADNFNHACGMVADRSRYFKILCADDWLDPRFLSRMIEFAESHPTVGIVSCHLQSGDTVRLTELPDSVTWLPGREACRKALLERSWFLPPPTAALYRADLLAGRRPFFPNQYPHCDISACFEHLQRVDFGVVHEVLAHVRVHEEQVSAPLRSLSASSAALVETLFSYGRQCLEPEEFDRLRREVLDDHYRELGRGLLRLRGTEFWTFQRKRLGDLGMHLDRFRVARAAFGLACNEMRRPGTALRKARSALTEAIALRL
jgi:glycosyltransferase involved in cell wall biosynthesis